MQELSLNILDIAENSIRAGASLVEISVVRSTPSQTLSVTVEDNGCGMNEEQVKRAADPFFTTRSTRPVGLGLPFFKMTAEMTGGRFSLCSTPGVGTRVEADYCYGHIDMFPLGDIPSTMIALILGHPGTNFLYRHEKDGNMFVFDTREVKQLLEGVEITSNEVLSFLRRMLEENIAEIDR